MQILLRFLLNPIAWIPYSAVFFYFSSKIKNPVKIKLCLKCYCILMMPLAIEALIRSIIYVRNIWGYLEAYHVSFLIVSILVLLFCIFTLNDKFSSLITRETYICTALVLTAIISIFPFVSLTFVASLQIFSVWGCIAIALYGLSRYSAPSKGIPAQEEIFALKTKRMLAIIGVVFCLILIWMISPFAFIEFRGVYFVFLSIVPILVLCLCIFTVNDRFSGFIIRNIYVCITLALIAMATMIAILIFTSWLFRVSLIGFAGGGCATAVLYWLLFYYNIPDNEADLPEKERVLNSMLCFCFRLTLCVIVFLFLHNIGALNNSDRKETFLSLIIIICIAVILYGLLRYVSPAKVAAEILEKQRILRSMLRFCIILMIWVFSCPLYMDINPGNKTIRELNRYYIMVAISVCHRTNPEWTSEFSPEEAVDITDRIVNVDWFIRSRLLKYVETGAISIIRKNEKYILRINAKAWRYSNRGVWPFPWWVYEEPLKDYKKGLAKDKKNYNSPDLSLPYDGTGSVFFREAAW